LSEDKTAKEEKNEPVEENDRFYEPKNWDKKLTIEDQPGSVTNTYCGQCGHIIHEGDRFCTKCGTESRAKKN
jgi:uncharacterized OB-fold protein